jgi:virulence-associated protein VagC
MLNSIRLREKADYSSNPELMPDEQITGNEAFHKYIEHTLPFLLESGGELTLLGEGGKFFIGPQNEQWDIVMLVKQNSLAAFMAFASNQEYLAGIGHRTAATLDSRLLPIVHAALTSKCSRTQLKLGR